MQIDPIFELVFRKLYGKPCWGAKQIHGSIISFEFGKPHLEICEPKRASTKASRRVQQFFARRHVHVQGEWQLLIWCCDWDVFVKGKRIGNSRSRSNLERVALSLEGQKLVGFSVEPRTSRCVFGFDLGGKLVTQPYDKDHDQWMVYEPSGKILTLRADGRYLYSTCYYTPPNKVPWKPIVPLKG